MQPTSTVSPPPGSPTAEAGLGRRLRSVGRQLNRAMRRGFAALATALMPVGPNEALPAEEQVRRVLLVRANFRMGNVVLATSLLPPLQARFPGARIDWLVGDTTATLLEGVTAGQVHRISRDFLWAPWRFVGLFAELREQRYDLAIDGGMTSFSGAFYAWLSGARGRVGAEGRGAAWLTTRLELPRCENIYWATDAVAAALGRPQAGWPVYRVSAVEAERAAALLERLRPGLATAAAVGLFVGGHRDKRWARAHWLELIRALAADGRTTLVFVGPEEREAVAEFAALAGPRTVIVPPQPLRVFAALLARVRLLVTPDSGPMHLAAALRVPVVAVLQKEGSRFFVPPGGCGTTLHPAPAAVLAAVGAHPAWGASARMPVAAGS